MVTLTEMLKENSGRYGRRTALIFNKRKISYNQLNEYNDFNIIINTTPVGVSPNLDDVLVDLTKFNNLECVIDLTYNPFKTQLLISANELGLKSINGLSMYIPMLFINTSSIA